ncbi:ABC transporter substrate-binding protein [Campylobacter hepaticus]|uniref:ABC transporter substrate-binding protein n=3 Tax=Campylobacter hepaticus TaxID=1813019 RepID=UPI001430BDA4|nr:extracellular solute-binding protein [Campylobacter hepaticus]QOW64473.1 extracellular solute-binding protein [Campylobacter hepaticus]
MKIKFLTPAQNYEDQSARLLREKIINKLPDVSFNSYSYLATLVNKNIPKDLTQNLINKKELGFNDNAFKATTLENKIYAIPFASSLPVVYYNMDLVKQAKWNKELPKTWEEIFDLAQKINLLEGKNGVYFGETDTWLILALSLQRGGKLINEKGKVDFSQEAWQETFKLLSDFHTLAKMPAIKRSEAISAFYAGNLGILIQTSAALSQTEKSINFPLKISQFPGMKPGGELPVGGSVVMLTNDKNKEAALKYIHFVTGEANAYVPQYTGYMTSNFLANAKLQDFYDKNYNHTIAPSQINLMGYWPSFPGDNALKATNTLWNYAQKLLMGISINYRDIAQEAQEEINLLLP